VPSGPRSGDDGEDRRRPRRQAFYRLYTPKGASVENKLPLILFLHGAGERGEDNAAQLKNCMKQFLKMQEKYPAFIVAPQCPRGKKWNEVDWQAASHVTPEKPSDPFASLIPLIHGLKKELPVDLKRLYVTGLSMGGYGTWDLITRLPDTFAAAVPICGGGDETKVARCRRSPSGSSMAPTTSSRPTGPAMVEALKKAGAEPSTPSIPRRPQQLGQGLRRGHLWRGRTEEETESARDPASWGKDFPERIVIVTRRREHLTQK
jgi:predicted peptidase